MNCISVTSEFGIIVRRAALEERCVRLEDLLLVFMTREPFDIDNVLISFGPHFGQEAVDVLTKQLSALGLKYFDDFLSLWEIIQSGAYSKQADLQKMRPGASDNRRRHSPALREDIEVTVTVHQI